jgi:hypothetical protein
MDQVNNEHRQQEAEVDYLLQEMLQGSVKKCNC